MAELTRALDDTLRRERHRIVAVLLRICGDLDLAEDALHDAVLAAMRAWSAGAPSNSGAWLTTAARNAALDAGRYRQRTARKLAELSAAADAATAIAETVDAIVGSSPAGSTTRRCCRAAGADLRPRPP